MNSSRSTEKWVGLTDKVEAATVGCMLGTAFAIAAGAVLLLSHELVGAERAADLSERVYCQTLDVCSPPLPDRQETSGQRIFLKPITPR